MLTEGDWGCIVLGAVSGQNDKQEIVVRINAKIDEGPDKGKTCTYEDTVNAKSSLYIARSCKAVGWAGRSLDTLTDDVTAWIAKTGGRSSVTIRHLEIKNGKRAGEFWAKVQAIGRGAKPLSAPAKSSIDDANDLMRRAMEADGSAPPHDEAPSPSSPVAEDDIPFATSRWTRVNGGVL